MTEWYSHFDSKDFTEVRGMQEALLLPEKPAMANETAQGTLEMSEDYDNHYSGTRPG
jgi:hypothetical protein